MKNTNKQNIDLKINNSPFVLLYVYYILSLCFFFNLSHLITFHLFKKLVCFIEMNSPGLLCTCICKRASKRISSNHAVAGFHLKRLRKQIAIHKHVVVSSFYLHPFPSIQHLLALLALLACLLACLHCLEVLIVNKYRFENVRRRAAMSECFRRRASTSEF